MSACFFPEGNTVLPSDNELRVLAKWAYVLFEAVGNIPCRFPEGTQPLWTDNEDRLQEKINIMSAGFSPVPSNARITEDGTVRITEDGTTRIIE